MSDIDKIKTKYVYVTNFIKDINFMMQELKNNYNVEINFKYIPCEENPADLLTRRIKFNKFNELLKFWLHGPKWLSEYHIQF